MFHKLDIQDQSSRRKMWIKTLTFSSDEEDVSDTQSETSHRHNTYNAQMIALRFPYPMFSDDSEDDENSMCSQRNLVETDKPNAIGLSLNECTCPVKKQNYGYKSKYKKSDLRKYGNESDHKNNMKSIRVTSNHKVKCSESSKHEYSNKNSKRSLKCSKNRNRPNLYFIDSSSSSEDETLSEGKTRMSSLKNNIEQNNKIMNIDKNTNRFLDSSSENLTDENEFTHTPLSHGHNQSSKLRRLHVLSTSPSSSDVDEENTGIISNNITNSSLNHHLNITQNYKNTESNLCCLFSSDDDESSTEFIPTVTDNLLSARHKPDTHSSNKRPVEESHLVIGDHINVKTNYSQKRKNNSASAKSSGVKGSEDLSSSNKKSIKFCEPKPLSRTAWTNIANASLKSKSVVSSSSAKMKALKKKFISSNASSIEIQKQFLNKAINNLKHNEMQFIKKGSESLKRTEGQTNKVKDSFGIASELSTNAFEYGGKATENNYTVNVNVFCSPPKQEHTINNEGQNISGSSPRHESEKLDINLSLTESEGCDTNSSGYGKKLRISHANSHRLKTNQNDLKLQPPLRPRKVSKMNNDKHDITSTEHSNGGDVLSNILSEMENNRYKIQRPLPKKSNDSTSDMIGWNLVGVNPPSMFHPQNQSNTNTLQSTPNSHFQRTNQQLNFNQITEQNSTHITNNENVLTQHRQSEPPWRHKDKSEINSETSSFKIMEEQESSSLQIGEVPAIYSISKSQPIVKFYLTNSEEDNGPSEIISQEKNGKKHLSLPFAKPASSLVGLTTNVYEEMSDRKKTSAGMTTNHTIRKRNSFCITQGPEKSNDLSSSKKSGNLHKLFVEGNTLKRKYNEPEIERIKPDFPQIKINKKIQNNVELSNQLNDEVKTKKLRRQTNSLLINENDLVLSTNLSKYHTLSRQQETSKNPLSRSVDVISKLGQKDEIIKSRDHTSNRVADIVHESNKKTIISSSTEGSSTSSDSDSRSSNSSSTDVPNMILSSPKEKTVIIKNFSSSKSNSANEFQTCDPKPKQDVYNGNILGNKNDQENIIVLSSSDSESDNCKHANNVVSKLDIAAITSECSKSKNNDSFLPEKSTKSFQNCGKETNVNTNLNGTDSDLWSKETNSVVGAKENIGTLCSSKETQHLDISNTENQTSHSSKHLNGTVETEIQRSVELIGKIRVKSFTDLGLNYNSPLPENALLSNQAVLDQDEHLQEKTAIMNIQNISVPQVSTKLNLTTNHNNMYITKGKQIINSCNLVKTNNNSVNKAQNGSVFFLINTQDNNALLLKPTVTNPASCKANADTYNYTHLKPNQEQSFVINNKSNIAPINLQPLFLPKPNVQPNGQQELILLNNGTTIVQQERPIEENSQSNNKESSAENNRPKHNQEDCTESLTISNTSNIQSHLEEGTANLIISSRLPKCPKKLEKLFFKLCDELFTEVVYLKIPKLVDDLHLSIVHDMMKEERQKKIDQLITSQTIESEKRRAEKDFNDTIKIRSQSFTPLFMTIVNKIKNKSNLTILVMALYCRIVQYLERIDPVNGQYRFKLRNIIKSMLQKHNMPMGKEVCAIFNKKISIFSENYSVIEKLLYKYDIYLEESQKVQNEDHSYALGTPEDPPNSSVKVMISEQSDKIVYASEKNKDNCSSPLPKAAVVPPIGNLDEIIFGS